MIGLATLTTPRFLRQHRSTESEPSPAPHPVHSCSIRVRRPQSFGESVSRHRSRERRRSTRHNQSAQPTCLALVLCSRFQVVESRFSSSRFQAVGGTLLASSLCERSLHHSRIAHWMAQHILSPALINSPTNTHRGHPASSATKAAMNHRAEITSSRCDGIHAGSVTQPAGAAQLTPAEMSASVVPFGV